MRPNNTSDLYLQLTMIENRTKLVAFGACLLLSLPSLLVTTSLWAVTRQSPGDGSPRHFDSWECYEKVTEYGPHQDRADLWLECSMILGVGNWRGPALGPNNLPENKWADWKVASK